MATEYGIFNDEGVIARDFYSEEEARAFAAKEFAEEEGLQISALCHEHPEHAAETCEECNAEEPEGNDTSEGEE